MLHRNHLSRTLAAALAASSLLTGVAAAALVNLNAPDRWWTFDEGHGTEVGDSSRNHVDGKLVNMNSKSWTRGISRSALFFDGKDDYVTIHDATKPVPGYYGTANGDFTVAFWVALLSNKRMSLVRRSTSDAAWWKCQRSLRVTKAADGTMRFEAYVWDGTDEKATGTTRVKPNVWYHVAMVCDVGGSKGGLRLFVNGVLEATRWNGAAQGGHNAWFIGRKNDKPQGGGGEIGFLHGVMDDLRIYNTRLSDKQVAALYLGTRRGQARRKITVASVEEEAAKLAAKSEQLEKKTNKPKEVAKKKDAAGGEGGAPTDARNLIVNGGFEEIDESDGFARAWHPHRWGESQARSSIRPDRVNFHDGERSIAVKSTGAGVKPGAFTSVVIGPGKYELSFWAVADVAEGKTAPVRSHVAGEEFGPARVGPDWKRYSHTFVTRDRSQNASVRLWTEAVGVLVWFDDVELVRVP